MNVQNLSIEQENSIFKKIYSGKIFYQVIWFGLSLAIILKDLLRDKFPNNFLIFKYNFLHLIHQQNLYLPYPEYNDLNHYGPTFGLLFAPFALLPNIVGVIVWATFNLWILYKAVQLLPINNFPKLMILLICSHELMTASASVQSNPLIAALIIFSYCLIKKEKDFWAALMITLGFFIKLYGIVGLVFFLFSKNKIHFILGLIVWSIVLFIAPMLVSSPHFVIQSYFDWYQDLVNKNLDNGVSFGTNISVMGMIVKIFHTKVSNLAVLIPALIIYCIPLLKFKFYKYKRYQLLLLASTLIFTVIFSTGSESPTYIIAFLGVAIWFVIQNKPFSNFNIFLFVLALILTSLSPSDLFPKYFRVNYVIPYGLKALPCLLIWLQIVFDMTFSKEETFISDENKTLNLVR